jgi:hypothetical protein
LTEPDRQTVDLDALLRKPLWTIEDLASYLDVLVNGLRKQRADGQAVSWLRLWEALEIQA